MPPKSERSCASLGPGLFSAISPLAPLLDRASFSSITASASGATITADLDYEPVRELLIPSYARAPFPVDDLLDLNMGNYRRWERRVRATLVISGSLHRYLLPSYTYPANARPADVRWWTLNDEHVTAFLCIQCTEHEVDQIDMRLARDSSAAALWAFLVKCHLNRGAHAQVFLLRDLLKLCFDPEQSLATQGNHALRICTEIVSMGVLDVKTFGKLAMLNMLCEPLWHLQSMIADAISRGTVENPFTTADVIQCLEVESAFVAEERSEHLKTDVTLSAQPITLAAQGVTSGRDMICSNCKHKGHPVAECFQPGGAAENHKQEILDKIASRRRGGAPRSGTASKTIYDNQGRAYHLAEVSAPAAKAAPAPAAPVDTAHSAVLDPGYQLATDSVDAAWLAAHDCSYSAMSAPLVSSIDWAHQALAMSDSSSHEPFLFDSGATTHLSPLHADFATFESIKPRGIRGVNRSVIYAIGSGRINLRVSPNQCLTLENALFVPGAAVHLISAYSVDFSSAAVTVRLPSGAVFFTGRRVGLGLFALASSAASAISAFIASSVPTLETWHCRLGHANYCATLAVAARAAPYAESSWTEENA
ncbi:hypothetical protein C2E23DRAFT_860099 [Lenzites betulinus]|nr:hypothetical protein C2E23DRAFT_860099 [Lenzites betulinus]